MEYETRVTSVTIVPAGEPLFCTGATTVRIDDEAAGEFLLIEQCPYAGPQKIAVNVEEVPLLIAALRRMAKECRSTD